MTVIVKMGRRVPKSLKTRIFKKIEGLIGFQENIWIMMKMSFSMSRKQFLRGDKKGKGKLERYDIDYEKESEDTFNNIEWMIITLQGDEAAEEEEYSEAMNMYKDIKKVLKNMPKDGKDERLSKVFKTKVLSEEKLKDAYAKGYGSKKDKNISKILLEMGLVTHIKWDKDFDTRAPSFDF